MGLGGVDFEHISFLNLKNSGIYMAKVKSVKRADILSMQTAAVGFNSGKAMMLNVTT